MKILVSTALLSPYRVDWLNELGKYAEVNILYLEEGNVERNQSWLEKRPQNCTYRLMKGKRYPKIGKVSYDVIKELKENGKNYDIIILDGYGYATQLLNIQYLAKHKIMYFVNIDGAVPKSKENIMAFHMKKRIISKIPYFLCGSKATGKLLLQYGAKESDIIYHPFTSLFAKEISLKISDENEKKQLRRKLNISEQYMIISVGRFSYLGGYGKGYDVLLRAAKLLPDNIGWYIIGGKPTEEFKGLTENAGLKNIHYVDFKQKDELQNYYRASDIFVLMTIGDVWGLVINEAMANGLPVITTNKCVAGVELIKNAENGYVIDVGDEKTLATCVETILGDSILKDKMGSNAISVIRDYTIENMAHIHMEVFNKYLGEQ